MAAPNPYNRLHSYTDHTINNPGVPHFGQDFDQDFNDVSRFSTEILARLALIQREDGELANAIVARDQMDPTFLDELIAEAQSSTGIIGPQGPAGPAIPGPVGAQGPKGDPLPWIVGTGAPNAQMGAFLQLYLNSANGDVWQRGTDLWTLAGNIRGPAGTGGGGGVTDHGLLTGLTDPDHPISAVSGLQAALDALQAAVSAVGNSTLKVYSQPLGPSANLNAGDLWFDTDDGNRLYRWNGVSWIDVTDARITTAAANAAAAMQAAATAQATADGKIVTFYGAQVPANPHVGDLWIRSDQGNLLHRWSGSAWVPLQDQAIQDALIAAGDAQATADGKITTFFQPTTPAGASLGDLWIDTDDGNHPYRFNGASWVSIRDATIAQAAANAAAAIQAAATAQATADGKIDVFYQAAAPNSGLGVGDLWIDTDDRQLYRWNGSQWQSVQDASIQAALTNAALAQATADGKLRAYYQIGAPSSGMATGDIWFDTDDFNRPYRYNGSAWVDISAIVGVSGGQVTTTSIADLAITNAKIQNAAITNAKIADAQITSAKIADGQITNAKIGNLQVDSAKIADLTVGTQKITGNAVTVSVSAYTNDSLLLGALGAYSTIQSGSIVVDANTPVAIIFSCQSLADLGFGDYYRIRIYRDSTMLFESLDLIASSSNGYPFTFTLSDIPGAGNFTYSVQAANTSVANRVSVARRSLILLETKR